MAMKQTKARRTDWVAWSSTATTPFHAAKVNRVRSLSNHAFVRMVRIFRFHETKFWLAAEFVALRSRNLLLDVG
jgi:hypothetical protein